MPDQQRANGRITVFLADDNILVREGVRALVGLEPDLVVVGVASDYDTLVAGAGELAPQVVVTDIRMPPTYQQEGIDAAKEVRKRHPGTGVVVLSQYDDPEFAISLLGEGSAGYAYLLKDRLADGDSLAKAIREVATGGSLLDPTIVKAMVNPVSSAGGLAPDEEELLQFVAEGRPVKAIAVSRGSTGEAVADEIEKLFLKLAQEASTGTSSSLRRLRMLHQAIIQREEQGETLSRLLPGGLAEKLRREGRHIGETEMLDVTVLMSDIRGYSGIAENAEPAALAGQLNEHRAEMNGAVLSEGGTVMQFVGDAVMAVFGAPLAQDDHARHAADAARNMHRAQAAVNERWAERGLAAFTMGIGLSSGRVAAALLGSEERIEYTLVGDAVNLTQRLQQWAEGGQTVVSQSTAELLGDSVSLEALEPAQVKGRAATVHAFRLGADTRR